MAICSKYRRLLSSILSIILCITIICGVTIQSVYCAPVVIPLASLAPIIAKILITAGVSFISYNALNGASRECINGMSESLAAELRNMAGSISNGVVKVSGNVWSYCKSWVDTRFNVGENTYNVTTTNSYVPDSFIDKTSEFVISYQNVQHVLQYRETVIDSVTYGILYEDGVPLANSKAIEADKWSEYVTMRIRIESGYIYFGMKDLAGVINFVVAMTSGYKYYADSIDGYNTLTGQAVTGADAIVDNPDYIHGNDITGDNSFVVSQDYADLLTKTPEAITDADVQAETETYVDLTCDDVKAETIPDTPADDTNTGILQGILDSLTGTIAGKITAINDTITNTIARILDQIRENTQEEEVESNNIFQFFISLLMILKQLVMIVLKFLMFIVVIRSIPAQSFLFDPNTKAVIDYIHNHSLPMFNVSFMQIINAFIGILVAVSVIRILNKNVRANL